MTYEMNNNNKINMATSTNTTHHPNNTNQTVEQQTPMTRFLLGDDDDSSDDSPIRLSSKRRRFSSSRRPPPRLHHYVDEDDDDDDDVDIEANDDEDEDDDVDINEDVLQTDMVDSVTGAAPSNRGDVPSEALHVVLTDSDVLDCPICLDPLCSPVFQCENGHIACSSCCSKVKRKCPSCCMPIGYNRCRAIENVIESVQVSCKNARHGCKKTMTYSKKTEHEQICPHATCFCPQPSCPFAGSSKSLYLHFSTQHAASTTRFTYNTTFTLCVERNQKNIFLQEQHGRVIFILNQELKEHGRVFNVDCVGPSTFKTSFEYHLTAKNTETSLLIQSVPEIYSKWSEHTLKKSYLTVPSDFLGHNGNLSLSVCIKKVISPV